jgi:hypothetical protein
MMNAPGGKLKWAVECKHNSRDIALSENGSLLPDIGSANGVESALTRLFI